MPDHVLPLLLTHYQSKCIQSIIIPQIGTLYSQQIKDALVCFQAHATAYTTCIL